MREWNGPSQRVIVLVRGFAWKDKTYNSLSHVALRYNGHPLE